MSEGYQTPLMDIFLKAAEEKGYSESDLLREARPGFKRLDGRSINHFYYCLL